MESDDHSACSEGTDNSWTLTYVRIHPQLANENISTHASNRNSHHNSWQYLDHFSHNGKTAMCNINKR